ncbi:MAG: hypothetical protein RR204_01455, partial [Raoultibacter sp.]
VSLRGKVARSAMLFGVARIYALYHAIPVQKTLPSSVFLPGFPAACGETCTASGLFYTHLLCIRKTPA